MKQKKKFFFLIIFFLLFLLFSLKLIVFYFQKKFCLWNLIFYLPSNKHGYLLKPNQKILRRGNDVVINNRGMRNVQNWNVEINKTKILFFGDSVTYGGSIVSNKDLFTEKTCKFLNTNLPNKFLCGNYGINGYSIESIVRLIKFREFYDEDIIVVTIIGNDMERVFHNIASQPFWSKKVPTYFPALTEVFFIYLEIFKNKIKYTFDGQYPAKEDKDYYLYLIKNFSEALEKSKKKYLILYSPEREEIFYPKHKKNDFIKNLLKNNLDNFYDLSEEMSFYKDELYYDSIHLNVSGHEIYGKIISTKIKEILAKENIY